jgi:hypothetical protein
MLSFAWNRALLAIRGMSFREHDPTEIAQKELIRVDALRAACEGLGWVDGVRAADVTTRYVRAALATGEPSRVTRALAAEAVFVSFRGSPTTPKVDAMLDRIDELAARIGSPELEAYALGTRGLVAQNMARFEDNYHYTSRALEVFRTRCTGVHWEMVSVTMFRLFGMVFTMRLREFTEVSRDALLDADQRGDLWLGTLIRTLVSPYVLLRTDRIPEAREQLRRGLEPWKHREFGFPHWNCLQAECFADMYEGKPEAALARLRNNAGNIARSKQMHVQLLRTNTSALLAKAHLLTYARDGDAGHLAVAEKLARKLAREGTAFARATACVLRGSTAMMRGDDERARIELEQVLAAEAQLQTTLLSDPTRLVYGRLIGGDGGAAMRAKAHRNLLELGIVDPERWATLQVPHRL